MNRPLAARELPLNQASNDEFFIGWLAMPEGQARFLRRISFGLIGLAAVIALILAGRQHSPGSGRWEDERPISFIGRAALDPYPRLLDATTGGSAMPGSVLLVTEGKFGAAERLRPFVGQTVRVTGTLLHRDGRTMVELASTQDSIQPIEAPAPTTRSAVRAVGTVTLRGEIIDSKCYLGAMKPGGGKTHKACAALCLSGGIPPMFVTRDQDNHEVFYLLTSADGSAAGELLAPWVGEPIELSGQLFVHGDLPILKVDATSLRRP